MDTKNLTSNDLIEVAATVKWYNQFRGYGFVSVKNISGDIFLHFSVLEKSHIDHLNNGDILQCRIRHTERGFQVDSIVEVLKCIKYTVDNSEPTEVEAQVKWFNGLKGFGFAQLPTGEDVFIHSSLLFKCGLKTLEPNSRVSVTIRKTNFGYDALSIKPA